MELTANLIIQYCIVGLVLLGAVVWIIWKLVGLRKRSNVKSCCGCALAGSCASKKLRIRKPKRETNVIPENYKCYENNENLER